MYVCLQSLQKLQRRGTSNWYVACISRYNYLIHTISAVAKSEVGDLSLSTQSVEIPDTLVSISSSSRKCVTVQITIHVLYIVIQHESYFQNCVFRNRAVDASASTCLSTTLENNSYEGIIRFG